MALLSLRGSGGRGLAVAGEAAEAAQCSGCWDGAEEHRVPEDTQLKETLRIRLASLPAAGAAQDSRFPSQPIRKRRNSQCPVRSGSPANSRRLRRARHQTPGYHGLQNSLRSLHLHGRTEGTERAYSSPLACDSSGKDYPDNGHLDELSTRLSCLHYQH